MAKILTDSAADLPTELVSQFGIHIMPAWVRFSAANYRTTSLDNARFYQLLKHEPDAPRTEPMSESEYRTKFADLSKDGGEVIYISISSAVSKAFETAQNAAQNLAGANVHVHDSGGFSLWQGFQAMRAAHMSALKMSTPSILRELDRMRAQARFFFTLDTLYYLRKGGRVNLAQYMLGSALDLKPILTLRNGYMEPAGQERGQERALARMQEMLLDTLQGDENIWVGVVHTNAPIRVTPMVEALKANLQPTYTLIAEAGANVAAHAGPGGIGAVTCPMASLSG